MLPGSASPGSVFKTAKLELILAIVCLAGILFYSGHFPSDDYDTGWHVKTGEYFFQLKKIPTKDQISFTSTSEHLPHFNLLTDLMLYGVYHLGGNEGLILFRIAAVWFIFTFIFLLCRLLSPQTLWLNFFCCVVLFSVIRMRLLIRPDILTLSCFASTYFFLWHFYLRRNFKALFAAGLITLLNFWLHGLWFACPLAWISFAIVETITHPDPSWSKKLFTPLVRTGLMVMTAIGVMVLLFTIPREAFFFPFLMLTQYPFEHSLPYEAHKLTSISGMGHFWVYLFFCTLFWLHLLRQKPKTREIFPLLILPLIWVPLGLRWARLFTFTAIVIFPLFVIGLGAVLSRWRRPLPASIRALSIFLIIFLTTLLANSHPSKHFGFGLNQDMFSENGMRFLREHPSSGHMFNDFALAGQLALEFAPDKKVFYDGRFLVNAPGFGEEVYYKIITARGSWRQLLQQYGVDYVVLTSWPNALSIALLNDPTWVLVYWDPTLIVFYRRTPENGTVINDYGYKLFNPFYAVRFLRGTPDEQNRELKRLLADAPYSSMAYDLSAKIALRNHQIPAAIAYFQKLMDMRATEAYPATQIGIIMVEAGNVAQAEDYFLYGARHRPAWDDFYALEELIKYERLRKNEKAVSYWSGKLKLLKMLSAWKFFE